jgi:hypothetical protein
VNPPLVKDEIAAINLIVVPEFSALTTFSGTFKQSRPFTINTSLSQFISTPSALQAETVAIVSLASNGLIIVDVPSASEAIATALCV